MNRKLKVYHGTLLVKGPVFVGNGNKLPKKEYALINCGSGIGVTDPMKTYQFFGRKGLLPQYRRFLMQNTKSDLDQFLNENRVRTNDLNSCFAYTLDAGDALKENARKTDIFEFVKDPYGCPYVPGSSLKGMLRTILLADKIMREPEQYRQDKRKIEAAAGRYERNRNRYLARETRELESRAFRTLSRSGTNPSDAVNDVLSGLIVSDSKPLSMKDCVVCKKIDVHTDGTAKPLPIARECLKPGTGIEFDMTVDTSVLDLDSEGIMRAVKQFDVRYRNAFEKHFRVRSQITDRTVFLGGGSGFASKTVIYPLLGYEDGLETTVDILNTVTSGNKHRTDIRSGVSPHVLKCTKYNGRLLEMGACELTFS